MKTICILHDIESDIDTRVSKEECDGNLTRMLAIEAKHGITATYNLLGLLYATKKDEIIESNDHAIGFHSYDHDISSLDQLGRVRDLDPAPKGYRPPQSVITPEITERALADHDFKWLASSTHSLGLHQPQVQCGIVKIPIAMDDWPLQSDQMDFEHWREVLLGEATQRDFFAFGLHDCYARHWLEAYEELILSIKSLGVRFVNCDELSAELLDTDARRESPRASHRS